MLQKVLSALQEWGTPPEHNSYILALDIGTEFVKALICKVDNGTGTVVGVGRQSQRLGDMYHGGIIDIDNVLVNVEHAVQEAEAMAKVSADQVILGIAGELVKGVSTTVEYTREQPDQKIAMPELKNIVHKMQWKAFEDVRKELAWETGLKEIDVKLVHAAVVDVLIDGYKISNPLGFTGTNVTLTLFNAFAPLLHYNSLVSIAEALDKDLLGIIVEPYAVSRCLGFEDGSDFSGIFVDIGGGTTDVAVVQNGGILGTRMFSIGGRVFTKRLAKKMDLSFQEAERLKLKYSAGKVTATKKIEIENIVRTDVDVWLTGLRLALEDYKDIDVLPSKILLCGGGACLPLLKNMLESRKWYEGLPFPKKPFISFITPEDIYNLEDGTGTLGDQQAVTPMALGNIAITMAGKERVLPRILGQVTRMRRH